MNGRELKGGGREGDDGTAATERRNTLNRFDQLLTELGQAGRLPVHDLPVAGRSSLHEHVLRFVRRVVVLPALYLGAVMD